MSTTFTPDSASLRVYRASAGSGKTFRLAGDFLQMVFHDPARYRHILAVTFTNRATAEMKTRIIGELHVLASGGKSDYLGELCRETGYEPGKIRERAGEILKRLLHDYSRFSVGTIDSFFQRVLQQFSREIGRAGGYTLELDTVHVLNEAIDRMMRSLGGDPVLKDWLVRYSLDTVEEGKSWNILSSIRNLGQELFKESYQAVDSGWFEIYRDKDELKKVVARMRSVKARFEQEMMDIGREGLKIMEQHDLVPSDFKGGSRSFVNYFGRLAGGEDFEPGKKALQACDREEEWFTGGTDKEEAIRHAFESGLNSLLKEALGKYEKEIVQYNSVCLVLRNLYATAILGDLARHVRDYLMEEDLFLLTDAGRFLRKIIGPGDAPFIYEKIGNRYLHFMIDEFQDTSRFQWENFLPLVRNGLAQNYSSLLVGDVKQSIYRWRNSDWHILAGEVEEQFPEGQLHFDTLDTNWRSHEHVVAFNNAFFGMAAESMREKFRQDAEEAGYHDPDAGGLITRAYDRLEQSLPRNHEKPGGYVRIEFVDKQDKNETVPAAIPGWLEKLQDLGYRPGEVAILVRKKEEGARVAEAVQQYAESGRAKPGYSYSLVSGDSLRLEQAVSVRFILTVFRWMVYPDDAVNRVQLYRLFYRYILKGEEDTDSIHGIFRAAGKPDEHAGGLVREVLEDLRRRLDEPGGWNLFERTERLIRRFGLHLFRDEQAYLLAFQDTVMDFQARYSGDVTAFLRWWEQNRPALQQTDQEGSFRVLTIHKAKGLEFEAVLLPFCTWNMGDGFSRLWCAAGESFPLFHGVVAVDNQKKLGQSHFSREYRQEKLNAYVDNLNLMYVAFTRAKKALLVWSPYPPQKNNLTTAGNLLWHVLETAANTGEKENLQNVLSVPFHREKGIYEYGSFPAAERELFAEPPVFDYQASFSAEGGLPQQGLRLRQESLEYFRLTGSATGQRVNRGRLLHELFERIAGPEDVKKELDRMVRSGRVPAGEADNLEKQVVRWLDHPTVREWFVPGREVKKEAGIYSPGGREKRPDRVLIDGKCATVVDYKFGEAEDERYIRQVEQYTALLRDMGYAPVKGYVWYVFLNKIVRTDGKEIIA
ncbi:MAG: UvrD-helicase domain-containing protein [Bacteroidales bacterium]